MLVTTLLDLVQRTLLEARIWASQWITFEALLPTTYPHPTALFAIGLFSKNVPSDPKKFLKSVWSLPQNAKRIVETLIREDETETSAEDVIEHMLLTLVLHPFPYPRSRDLGFVVHISTWWSELSHWLDVKRTLLSLDYTTTYPYEQIHLTTLPHCSLCHSFDHFRSECPFPSIPLWNGPR